MGRARTGRVVQRVVRLTEKESEEVDRKAAEVGISPAAFLRQAALKRFPRQNGKLDKEIQKEIWRQISGAARNLNQLTKLSNSGIYQPREIEALSFEIRRLTSVFLETVGG